MESVTCISPINIAVVKYWGKANEDLNIPLNCSVSVTLDPADLCATTTMCISSEYEKDEMTLNGRFEDIDKNKRIQRCLKKVNREKKCKITSSNNFPTAAGLASSAAGYACLAKCLSTLYGFEEDISVLARLGSGSACRSVCGGFVRWQKGVIPDGSDSIAVQIADENFWNKLRIIILVVSNKQKAVGSTEAMRRSAKTSELLKYRVAKTAEENTKAIEKAILEKDFATFAEITMKESNQLHAICQDTYPPINPPYMNSISHDIVQFVHKYNYETMKAAYTFDAGSNAVLFTLQESFDELLSAILKYFPSNQTESYINLTADHVSRLKNKEVDIPDLNVFQENSLQRIICTKVGKGAYVSEKS